MTADESTAASTVLDGIAVRLADEGVPIGAISRALKLPSPDVRDTLHAAHQRSQIVSVPHSDWPPGSTRDNRVPACVRFDMSDPGFLTLLVKEFHITGTMSVMLAALLRRPEMTTTALHLIMQKEERVDPTDPKIVTVYICKLRKFLKPHGVTIKTIWGRGYCLTPEGRAYILARIGMPIVDDGILAGAALAASSGGVVRVPSKAGEEAGVAAAH